MQLAPARAAVLAAEVRHVEPRERLVVVERSAARVVADEVQAARRVAADLGSRGWDPRLAPLSEVVRSARLAASEEVS